jgi:hypothetical protein
MELKVSGLENIKYPFEVKWFDRNY